ncbi:hypothetical protein BHC43_10485 [Snodgrassella alvi]|uniref:hypothetical protein n=1 Tax=Snodgrassella alvi TaxID=1196083 RepID=UPI000C1DD42F|nr:hypothetical protein [Snodgrassella alvi]PIT36520.1 hypothetical protein BHC43_10485 [Snodgrassella alvi]
MALERGGYAEKLGNRYETNWVAYQLVRLLEEKIAWVIVEPIGQDEPGVDLVIGNHDGTTEHHQCKSSKGESEYWTLSHLHNAEILSNALYQIKRTNTEYHLVSPLSCKHLSDLRDSALNSNGYANDFLRYQINTNKRREKFFQQLCDYLNLDINNPSDINTAIVFLKKFKIEQFIFNENVLDSLLGKISLLYSADSFNLKSLFEFLKHYTTDNNKLRQQITSFSLHQDLQKAGFERTTFNDDKRVSTVVIKLSSEFENSLRPFLIDGAIIQKDEVKQLIASVNHHAVTLLTAEAGMGKSVLLLQLHDYLQQQNIVSIPVRLDRRRPENNLTEFGKALGFISSPAVCVKKFAAGKQIVFILDQLDAIRWTTVHSCQALEICRQFVQSIIELRKKGINISVVLAARTFDMYEDIALSGWIESIDKECAKIKVSELSAATVSEKIAGYENYSVLTIEKKRILSIPLWLGFYLAIAKRIQSAPKFDNKLELVKKFWDNRMQEVKQCGVDVSAALAQVDRIIDILISNNCLSIAENIVVAGNGELSALISVGLLSSQNNQISFRHQALLDYRVGNALFQTALNSPAKLLVALGAKEEQMLTRREQLKYAMNLLLQTNQQSFCKCVETILFAENVRFHLKHLILCCIKEIQELKYPARQLVDTIIAEPQFCEQFLLNGCISNSYIIKYLIEKKYIAKWLHSSEDNLSILSINLLFSVVRDIPNSVVNEITPLIGQSEQLDNIIRRTLPKDLENDADVLFEFRKKLIKKGYTPENVNWKILAKKNPQRALLLIRMILDIYWADLCAITDSDNYDRNTLDSNNCNWPEQTTKFVMELAKLEPQAVTKFLLEYINPIFADNSEKKVVDKWFYQLQKPIGHKTSIQRTIFELLEVAGKELQSKPYQLFVLTNPYLNTSNPILIHIMANMLLNLSSEYADMVLNWLLIKPKRLCCGNFWYESEWNLAGKLIEKFSPDCSDELIKLLEQTIYYLPPSRNINDIKSILASRKHGKYEHYWGKAQFILLSQLDEHRKSIKTKELIAVLQRKFGNYKNINHGYIVKEFGGWVSSPLPKEKILSDNSWRKLILTPIARLNSNKWNQKSENQLTESNIKNYAHDFETNVRNQPSRFARLALTLPKTIDEEFIDALFNGLINSARNNVDEKFQSEWQPCPDDLLEQVILHFYHKKPVLSLVKLIARRVECFSKLYIDKLTYLAKFSDNPEKSSFNDNNIHENDLVYSNRIWQDSQNYVRSVAFHGIASRFYINKEFALNHIEMITLARNDNHPAVRVTVIELLLPMLNYDANYAHEQFISACYRDIWLSLICRAHYFFDVGFDGNYQPQYTELVLVMLGSDIEDVRKEAAKQIYKRWFLKNLFTKELEQVLKGDSILRKGYADFIIEVLEKDQYHDYINKIEYAYELLLNDDNLEIAKEVGVCILKENYWKKNNLNKLFFIFVKSRVAIHCIFELSWAIKNYPGKLADLCPLLLNLVENISRRYQDKDILEPWYHESNLITVVQRIYDEAMEDEDINTLTKCLDIYDKLFKLKPFTALKLTQSLDIGVLA